MISPPGPAWRGDLAESLQKFYAKKLKFRGEPTPIQFRPFCGTIVGGAFFCRRQGRARRSHLVFGQTYLFLVSPHFSFLTEILSCFVVICLCSIPGCGFSVPPHRESTNHSQSFVVGQSPRWHHSLFIPQHSGFCSLFSCHIPFDDTPERRSRPRFPLSAFRRTNVTT